MCFTRYLNLDSFRSKPAKITPHPFFPCNLEPPNPLSVAGLSQLVKWTALAAFGLCLRRNPTLLHLGWLKWRCLEVFVWHFWWCKVYFGACYLWEDAWRNMIQMVEKKMYSTCVSSFSSGETCKTRLNQLDSWWNSHFSLVMRFGI